MRVISRTNKNTWFRQLLVGERPVELINTSIFRSRNYSNFSNFDVVRELFSCTVVGTWKYKLNEKEGKLQRMHSWKYLLYKIRSKSKDIPLKRKGPGYLPWEDQFNSNLEKIIIFLNQEDINACAHALRLATNYKQLTLFPWTARSRGNCIHA